MTRKIFSCTTVMQSLLQNSKPIENVKDWLAGQAKEYELRYLLAHADDGVIWGLVDDDGLVTSFDVAKDDDTARNYCPELRTSTLQQARLFSKEAELLLWRDGHNLLQARLVQDVAGVENPAWEAAFDEPQMLWGNDGVKLSRGFTLLEDGAQGLRHAIPVAKDAIPVEKDGDGKLNLVPPKLVIRHYLAKDDFARVDLSRLVGFEGVEGE